MELQMIMWPLAILSACLTSYTCTMVNAIDRNYVSKPISNVELCSDILGIQIAFSASKLLFTQIYYALSKWVCSCDKFHSPPKVITNGIENHMNNNCVFAIVIIVIMNIIDRIEIGKNCRCFWCCNVFQVCSLPTPQQLCPNVQPKFE